MLRVAQISFFLDPQRREPEQILHDWEALVDVAEMVARTGTQVSVVQACCRNARLVRGGVSYHFIAPERGRLSIAGSERFARLIRELRADVFHVQGLGFSHDVRTLARLAPEIPIFLQDHADRVPRWWRRRECRLGLSAAAGVSFCASAQARPFLVAAMLQPHTAIFEIPECSSRFTMADRGAARRATGMHGDPAVLWVGHLDRNKDPLTVLAGISEAAERLPRLQLWCCFGSAPLLAEVRERIGRDVRLAQRVHLMGRVEHADVEKLMRAADLFVLGSHREGSGFALIEAMACGLPPVVTDIPSFRALTVDGEIGALWPCGDASKFSEALVSVARQSLPELRAAVREHFEAELSFEAVGKKLVAAYTRLAGSKAALAGSPLHLGHA